MRTMSMALPDYNKLNLPVVYYDCCKNIRSIGLFKIFNDTVDSSYVSRNGGCFMKHMHVSQ